MEFLLKVRQRPLHEVFRDGSSTRVRPADGAVKRVRSPGRCLEIGATGLFRPSPWNSSHGMIRPCPFS
jgi:hypothetical protein